MFILTEKVILFLTDGEKTAGGDPLSLIAKRNGDLENEIVILTYGLGACKYSVSLYREKLLLTQKTIFFKNAKRCYPYTSQPCHMFIQDLKTLYYFYITAAI
jgi:hypothetical protein